MQPLDFNPVQIQAIVAEARKFSANNPEARLAYMKEKYFEFYETYPVLLSCACKDDFNMAQLKFMLDKLGDVKKRKAKMEDVDRDVRVRLTEKYVNPVLNRLDPTPQDGSGGGGGFSVNVKSADPDIKVDVVSAPDLENGKK